MPKLKLGPIADDKPVKVTLELPAGLHRDLAAYANILARESGQPATDPISLIVPMLERFIATDRGFAKARRAGAQRHDAMCAKIDRPRKRRTRNAPPMILPDDLYDYLDDRPQRPGEPRAADDRAVYSLPVVDDWPDSVPVTEAEIDVFERYFGDILDKIFGASTS